MLLITFENEKYQYFLICFTVGIQKNHSLFILLKKIFIIFKIDFQSLLKH